MDKKQTDRVGKIKGPPTCEVINQLRLASLWPGAIATTGEIEDERQRVEALHQCRIEAHQVTYPTLSGARSTRVEWKIV